MADNIYATTAFVQRILDDGHATIKLSARQAFDLTQRSVMGVLCPLTSSRLNLLKSNAQSWTIYEVMTYCAALNGVVVTSDTGTKWYNPSARTLLSTRVGHCHHGHSPRTISLPIHL